MKLTPELTRGTLVALPRFQLRRVEVLDAVDVEGILAHAATFDQVSGLLRNILADDATGFFLKKSDHI